MKKIISILMLLLILSSCSQKADNEVAETYKEENKVVTENLQLPEVEQQEEQADTETEDETQIKDIQQEPVDSETNSNSEDIILSDTIVSTNVATYNSIDSLWEDADYVIVGSPTQSYYEATQYWLDDFKKPTEFSNISLVYSYSVRPFKVNKVYKGEDMKLKEIQVCEHVLTKDGETQVMEGSFPTEEGSKYILFLFRANTEEEQYFPLLYQGKYSLNDSDNKEQKNISQDMYKQVKEKFKDEIK